MSQGDIACPKCKQAMQEGYVTDQMGVARWHEGPVRRLLGMPLVQWSKRRIPMIVYRCPTCGYLESYAK